MEQASVCLRNSTRRYHNDCLMPASPNPPIGIPRKPPVESKQGYLLSKVRSPLIGSMRRHKRFSPACEASFGYAETCPTNIVASKAKTTMAGITQDSYYRGDIQGLRGLAVWLVIIYHAVPQQLPGGYVGVDVFFVISGFVITSLIQRDLNKNSFSLRGFYSRRIIRLFPALFAMLSAALLAGACILSPRDLRELGRTTISTVFFASNIDFNLILGYFNSESTLKRFCILGRLRWKNSSTCSSRWS